MLHTTRRQTSGCMLAPTAHHTAVRMMHKFQGPSVACRAELYRSQDAQRAANEKASREAAQRSQAEAQAQALRRDMEYVQKDLQAGLRSASVTMLQLAPLCGSCTQGEMWSLLGGTCSCEAGYLVSTGQACCQSALPQRMSTGPRLLGAVPKTEGQHNQVRTQLQDTSADQPAARHFKVRS